MGRLYIYILLLIYIYIFFIYIYFYYILYLTENDDLSLITMFKYIYILTYLFRTIFNYTNQIYKSNHFNNIYNIIYIYRAGQYRRYSIY